MRKGIATCAPTKTPGAICRVEEINQSLAELRATQIRFIERLGIPGPDPSPPPSPFGMAPQLSLIEDQIRDCKTLMEILHEFF